jgi:hypothetical protein
VFVAAIVAEVQFLPWLIGLFFAGVDLHLPRLSITSHHTSQATTKMSDNGTTRFQRDK